MEQVKNKLRIVHIPDINNTKMRESPFIVEVQNEREAYLVEQALAIQHLYLYTNDSISDYTNIISVEMKTDDGWEDYYNFEEDCRWDELCENFEDHLIGENTVKNI